MEGAGARARAGRSSSIRASLLVGLAVASLVGGGGCGYTLGFRPAKGIETVAVPVAANASLRRGIELELTELIRNEVLLKTPIAIASEGEADAVLHVSIVNVSERVLVEDANDDVVSSSVTVGVLVTLEDRRDGSKPLDAVGVSPETAEFVLDDGENRDTATTEALQDLAERIVFLLEEPWGG